MAKGLIGTPTSIRTGAGPLADADEALSLRNPTTTPWAS
jgi:hypothetical protein